MNFLDFLFPKRCVGCRKIGEYVCTNCFSTFSFDVKLLCVVCNKASFNGLTHPGCRGRYTIDGVFAGVVYGQVIRKLLYQFKYQPYVADMASFVSQLCYEGLIQNEILSTIVHSSRQVIVPIPLHKNKFRARGFNQSALLAQRLAVLFNLDYADILLRVKETKPQYGLKKDERRDNMKGAFALDTERMEHILQKEIILVDDLLTSGSTMDEAARILKRAGFTKVWGITFSRDQVSD